MLFVFPAVMIYSIKKYWAPEPKSLISSEDNQRCTKEVMLQEIHMRQICCSRNLIIKRRFSAFFEETSMDKDLSFLTYACYFMLRRLLMAIIVVVLRKFLWMQIFLKAMSIVTAVIIIGEANYFETKFKQRLEFANETLAMLMLYNMICFSPFVLNVEARFKMGYFCCVVEALALAFNLFLMMSESLSSIILKMRVWFAKRKLPIERSEHLRERAKGRFLRRERNRERANRKHDYGYEEVNEELKSSDEDQVTFAV